MSRLFLAIWPPDEVIEHLMSIRRKDQPGVRFVQPDRWHITLRFLGEAHAGEVIGAMDGVDLPSAHAELGPAVDVLADRALVIPVRGLDELAGAVRAGTRHLGEPDRHRFVGHLTLARLKPRARMPPALGTLCGAAFDVHEVALVCSRLERDGARYDNVESWPVSG